MGIQKKKGTLKIISFPFKVEFYFYEHVCQEMASNDFGLKNFRSETKLLK